MFASSSRVAPTALGLHPHEKDRRETGFASDCRQGLYHLMSVSSSRRQQLLSVTAVHLRTLGGRRQRPSQPSDNSPRGIFQVFIYT